MLREKRQEVSRCHTLLAWDIDLITYFYLIFLF